LKGVWEFELVNFADYALPAVLLLLITSFTLLSKPDWRWSLLALYLQYLGVFILVASAWSTVMAASRLVSGWIAGAVIGMALIGLPEAAQAQETGKSDSSRTGGRSVPRDLLTGRLFRLLAAALVVLIVLSIFNPVMNWTPGLSIGQAMGGLTLIGMGLLQLGFTARTFHTILGLLTLLSGFQILYSAVETSALVAGLLAVVDLGLALVGAYLLLSSQMEEIE
jgi:hydrogenase-4 membrane subunit HyfE